MDPYRTKCTLNDSVNSDTSRLRHFKLRILQAFEYVNITKAASYNDSNMSTFHYRKISRLQDVKMCHMQ